MSFLSYAQNNEDVLLWRALGHVRNGFYIDAGANDPVEHSVTKAFYDAGWHGISIEPLPAFHQRFLEQRPRDINMAIAVGAHDGSLALFDIPAVNGWATPDRTVADAHRAEGYEVRELEVPVRTLASVCAQHVRGEIHFLKIDVEGFEAEVLRGMDFAKWRPWVLVIEATAPNSRVANHETWEALVTGQRYRYAHFDGLNRYYVAEEHAGLADALAIQPNVFDDYISYHLDLAWRAAEASNASAAESAERLAQAARKQWEAEARSDQSSAALREALAHAAALLERYNDANAALLAAQTEAASLKVRHEHASQGLLASQAQAGALLARCDDANLALLAAQAQGEDLRVQLARAAASIESQDAQLARAALDLEGLDVQMARTAAELEVRHAQLERCHAAVRAADEHTAAARAASVELQAQLTRATATIESKDAQLARMSAELEARDGQLERSQARMRSGEERRAAALAATAELQAQLAAEQANGAALRQQYDQLGQQAHAASAWGRDLEQRLLATLSSTSWRVTGPLRLAGTLLLRVRGAAPGARSRRLLQRLLARAAASERMRRLLIPVLLRFPALARMASEIRRADPAPATPPGTVQPPDELRALPESARRVLADLERARRNHTGTGS